MDRGTWGPDGPPEEAYSRVSDPGLYLSLHPVADRLVSRLVSRYRVEAEAAEVTGPWRGIERATRLVPDGGGAPVTVIWTGVGVAVRAGHAFERGLPFCGCDACDEDPGWLATDLEETLEALASGGLVETRRSHRIGADEASVELRGPRGGNRSRGRITERRDPRHAIPVGTIAWPPWTPR
jgi:hypothetical protein